MAGRKVKSLGKGQLKTDSTVLYAVPDLTYAEVFKVTLAAAAAVTLNLYLQTGPKLYRITPKDCAMDGGDCLELTHYTMSPGDALVGDASVADVVDFTVNGAEER